jgi:hypothetical protein
MVPGASSFRKIQLVNAMKPAILELAQELTGQPDPESAMSEVLHAYLQLKIRRCRRLIARLERKYGMGFEEFERRLGVELPLSWEHERDFLAWEEALTNLRYFQEQAQQLHAHAS